MTKRLTASEAAAKAEAVKSEALARAKARAAATKKYARAWVTQRKNLLEAAVNGNNFFETTKPIIFCNTLLNLGFKVSEVPEIPIVNEFGIKAKYADQITCDVANAKDLVNELIEKLSDKYVPVFGEFRHLRNAMHIALSDFIEYCDDEGDSCINHFADALKHPDAYSDLEKNEKLLIKIENAVANKVALEFDQEQELEKAQDAKWEAELETVDTFDAYDDLPDSIEISSQYKKFVIEWEWDESLAAKEFNDDFCSPWLCWIADQPGQEFFQKVFEQIAQQVDSGKKSLKFLLLEVDGRWELSSNSTDSSQSIPIALLSEVLTIYGYQVSKTAIKDNSHQVMVQW
jgi:hypothetical protein